MRPGIATFIAGEIEAWRGPKGHALDVGSMDVNGNLSKVFENRGWRYIGLDVAPGPNVDVVCDAENLVKEFGVDRFECVVSSDALEHMENMIEVVRQMRMVLKPGGLLILSAAGNGFGEHRHPIDCWRVLPDGMKYFLRGYNDVHIEHDIVGRGVKP